MHHGVHPTLARPALLAAALIVGVLSLRALASHRADPLPSTSRPRTAAVDRVTPPTQAAALRQGRPLDINRASADELRLLPGIGPKLAARIVEARGRRGGFDTLADLDAVPGIGPKKLRQLSPLIRIGARAQSATSQPNESVSAK